MQTIEVPDHLAPAVRSMIAKLVEKGQDYSDGEWTDNFRSVADHFGIPQYEACDFLEVLKLSRLRSMRRRTRTGESIADQYLDKANFALLAYALLLHANAAAHPQEFDINRPEVIAAAKSRVFDYDHGPIQSGGRNEVTFSGRGTTFSGGPEQRPETAP